MILLQNDIFSSFPGTFLPNFDGTLLEYGLVCGRREYV
jgi:hypothetical protein